MEKLTIDISSILYWVILYYSVVNIFTLLFDMTEMKINKRNVFNPFRSYKDSSHIAPFLFVLVLGLIISFGIDFIVFAIKRIDFIFRW